jgi:hypothetical protein
LFCSEDRGAKRKKRGVLDEGSGLRMRGGNLEMNGRERPGDIELEKGNAAG